MLHIVLFEPEIPPNTGNIMRLCANTGAHLHLIEPLAFDIDDKRMRRAGLDYQEWENINIHKNFSDFMNHSDIKEKRIFACTTKAKNNYHEISYQAGDVLLFGPETRGLPENIRMQIGIQNNIRIPMKAESRSLNLSNSVAIILYEALRQLDFPDLIQGA